MTVGFKTSALRRCYESHRAAVRAWGEKIGRRYIQRVGILFAAASAQDLFEIQALEFHPLTGNRKGQYALRLDGAWRLIVTFADKAMSEVVVEEVSDHYGD